MGSTLRYLGTSLEHYHCHKIFCKKTRSERISNTVFFQHQYITQPTVTPEDQIVKAVGNLTSALRQRINACGQEEMEVLQRMNEILNNAKPKDVDLQRPHIRTKGGVAWRRLAAIPQENTNSKGGDSNR